MLHISLRAPTVAPHTTVGALKLAIYDNPQGMRVPSNGRDFCEKLFPFI